MIFPSRLNNPQKRLFIIMKLPLTCNNFIINGKHPQNHGNSYSLRHKSGMLRYRGIFLVGENHRADVSAGLIASLIPYWECLPILFLI